MPRGPLRWCHVVATDMTGSEWKVQYEVQKVAGSKISTRFRPAGCMRTRSQARNQNRRQQQITPVIVEEPKIPMADNHTMAQMLQAPTEGYEDAIVIPEINANFELKHGLFNLVQNKQFFGHDKEDPHAHIRYFNKITP
ncbi:hypothetical protein Tco_1042797 [Tanacetum coccineum]|uniref:Reverse transcriptase domain-containing protein n=1 Tax=Tanacetum coccineum TaxID=301880 RepID=A0ABQ5GMF8_9ASTR